MFNVFSSRMSKKTKDYVSQNIFLKKYSQKRAKKATHNIIDARMQKW
jgi:hypothetical protein